MRYVFLYLICAASALAAQTTTSGDKNVPVIPPDHHTGTPLPSYMIIPPAGRAVDFQQAYDFLRKEKSTGKVYFELSDGSTISNIIEMLVMPNSTLIIFRYNSNQGINFQVVKIEEIVNLRY